PVTHHACIRSFAQEDQGLAASSILIDQPAASGSHVVVPRVTGTEERSARRDQKRDAGLQLDWAGEECVVAAGPAKLYGGAWLAAIDRFLNPQGIRPVLICFRYASVLGGELGCERNADGRESRFGYSASVLREGKQSGRQQYNKKEEGMTDRRQLSV